MFLQQAKTKRIQAKDWEFITLHTSYQHNLLGTFAYAMWKAIEWKIHGTKVGQQEKEVILLWDYEKFTSVVGNQLHHTIKVYTVNQSNNLHEADFNKMFDVLKQNQNEANDIKAELERHKHDLLALVADSPSTYSLTPLPTPAYNTSTYASPAPNYNTSNYSTPSPTYTTTMYATPEHAYVPVKYASLPPKYNTLEGTRVLEHAEVDLM
ncbi:hypothetical protein Tco_1560937 [Tanacetum coccineum]